MSFKAQPAPKCVACSESVYPMEKIDYDGQTYHLACFKCLHCKNTVQLTGVAMIKGDLYCKNCFMKIFKREGKYSSFETPARSPNASPAPTTVAPAACPSPTLKPEVSRPKTLPSHTNGTNGTTPTPTPTKPVEKSNGLPPTSPTSIVAPKAVSISSSPITIIDESLNNPPSRESAESARRRSTILLESCVADDCENPRVARYSYCTKHGNYDVQELKPLVEAVEKRDASGVRNLFQNTPASIIFKTSRDGISPLEMAFAGIRNSRGCGIAMVAAIKTHIEKLENENKSLKEQQILLEQAVAKHVKGGSAPASAADQSAEVAQLQAENKALKEQQVLLEQAVAKHVKAAAAAPAATPAADQSAEVAALQAQVKQLEDAVGKSIKARADLVDQVTKHKDAAKAWENEKATLLEQQSQLEAALAKRMTQEVSA